MKESDILFESGDYHVIENKHKKAYEVCKYNGTHSIVVATIGISLGIDRVKEEMICPSGN